MAKPPTPDARTFGQDLMRGEHTVGAGHGRADRHTEDLRGGLTHRTTTDPYRAPKPNAVPGGNRGGNSGKTAYTAGAKTNLGGLVQNLHAHAYDGGTEDGAGASGTSIFDPVLTELLIRWFCPPKGKILDPFAGGSVRGIVASHLGRAYTGIDLRPEQVAANEDQLSIAGEPKPEWIAGDSVNIPQLLPKEYQADFVFTCPPYWNLEVYSNDPRDLSMLSARDFFTVHAQIVRAACARLKNDRFAAWVVGDVRDDKGLYVNLPGMTVQAFTDAGLRLYNEAILITAAGSLALRTGKQFLASRKLGKSHQNVLVFVKGDPVKATKAIGAVDFGDIPELEVEADDEQPSASKPPPRGGDPKALSSYGEVME